MNRKFILLAMLAVIGTVEFVLMGAFDYLGVQVGVLESLVDTAVLVAVCAPLLHRLLVRSERAVRESEERLRDFLENANDLIHSVTPEGHFRYVNRAWRETLGYSEDEIPQLSLRDIISPDRREESAARFRRVLRGETVSNFETVYVTKDGQNILVSGSTNCQFEGGKAVATWGIFRNITESKRAAKALEETNRKLKHWVAQLEKRSRETDLLNEMAGLLSTALTVDEAYGIIFQFAPRLFPTENGAVCVLSSSRNFVETMAVWGGTLVGERVFAPEHCWALRQGRTYRVKGSGPEMHCQHVGPGAAAGYLCIPMMAQSDALALFSRLRQAQPAFTPARERLALVQASHPGSPQTPQAQAEGASHEAEVQRGQEGRRA